MSDLDDVMHISGIQSDDFRRLPVFVVNALPETPVGALGHKALLSFQASVRRHGIYALDEDKLRLWIVDMILAGLKQTTRRRYFNSIHALCKSTYDFSASDPFENVRQDLNRDYHVDFMRIDYNLNLLNRVVKSKERSEYADIFLCLLYDVNATVDSIINFNFDEAHHMLPQIEDIADKYRKGSRTKYVFGLCQRQIRDTQIKRNVINGVLKALAGSGMRFGESFSRDSIREIWIAAALRCGIPTSEIMAVLKSVPNNYAFLEMVRPADLSQSQKSEIIRRVADVINDNKKYWYAMQLRSGKTPDDVKKKLEAEAYPRLKEIAFYYPTRTVFKKKGKKMSKVEVPYLPGVLFFYIRRDDVKPLFSQYIGGEAWCYRYANHPDSPYSAISRQEMEQFQRYIGAFSNDIQMSMITHDSTLSVDDIVRVSGGVMDGRICRITEINHANGKRTYSLALTEQLAVQWEITDVEESQLVPL